MEIIPAIKCEHVSLPEKMMQAVEVLVEVRNLKLHFLKCFAFARDRIFCYSCVVLV